MSRRTITIAALLAIAVAGDPAGATPGAPIRNARIVETTPPRPLVPEATRAMAPWAASLSPVSVTMRNTNAQAAIRLYADDGTIDPVAARKFMRVACSVEEPSLDGPSPPREPLPMRLVQLVYRASYHFGGAPVVIVSATRRRERGKHGRGEAIDFKLEGVRASVLAAWLRQTPRAGVGIYTNPNTQYVHLDVRAHSYHWLDASPPGVSWRERLLKDPTQETRDASYVPVMDLPEVAAAVN